MENINTATEVKHDMQAWAQTARELGLRVIWHPMRTEVVIFSRKDEDLLLLVTADTLSIGDHGMDQFVPCTPERAVAALGRMARADLAKY